MESQKQLEFSFSFTLFFHFHSFLLRLLQQAELRRGRFFFSHSIDIILSQLCKAMASIFKSKLKINKRQQQQLRSMWKICFTTIWLDSFSILLEFFSLVGQSDSWNHQTSETGDSLVPQQWCEAESTDTHNFNGNLFRMFIFSMFLFSPDSRFHPLSISERTIRWEESFFNSHSHTRAKGLCRFSPHPSVVLGMVAKLLCFYIFSEFPCLFCCWFANERKFAQFFPRNIFMRMVKNPSPN